MNSEVSAGTLPDQPSPDGGLVGGTAPADFEPPPRPWIAFAAALTIALVVVGAVLYGGIRRGSTPPPKTDFAGLIVELPSGDEVTLTNASVECTPGAGDKQGVLAELSGSVVDQASGAEVDVSLVVGAVSYARQQNLSLPHIQEPDDPRFAMLRVELPAQTYASDQGASGGSFAVQAECTANPFVEVIADGALGEVGGTDSIRISGSLRASG